MAVIAIYSVKGGVGKTTLAVDLAWRLASRFGHETLLWDLDPQGGAGFLLGKEDDFRQRAASVFQRDGKPRQLIEPTAFPRLSLLNADDSLRSLPFQLARFGHRRRLAMLAAQLRSDFDRIVLDCPSGLSEVSDQVLGAADVLIVPLPASPLSARALESVRRELLRQHERHPPILPVLAMYDSRRKLHREVAATVAAGWPVIPVSTHLEQSAVRQAPAGSFANGTDAGRALDRLCQGIEQRLRRDQHRAQQMQPALAF